MKKTTISLLAVLLTGLTIADGASAATVSGTYADKRGDGPTKSRDITKVKATYNSATGAVSFRVKLAGAIKSPKTQFNAGVGTLDKKGRCGFPLGVLGANFPGTVGVWLRQEKAGSAPSGKGIATLKESGLTINIKTKQAALQGLKVNCAEVIISNPNKSSQRYDGTGPIRLK